MRCLFFYFILNVIFLCAMEDLPLELQFLILEKAPDKQKQILTLRRLNSNFANLILHFGRFHCLLA